MPANLVLVGFMGSGKSSAGLRAAEIMGAEFIDLDSRIEEMTGRTIEAIFNEQGEVRFRAFESAALAMALADGGRVVAVGGGAVMDDANWDLIRDGNVVVRLWSSDEATLARLGNGDLRPLAGGGRLRESPDAAARLLRLAAAREYRYAEAEHQVDTTGRDIEAVATDVVAVARRAGMGPGSGA